MEQVKLWVVLILSGIIASCTKSYSLEDYEDCPELRNTEIISKDERNQLCTYKDVYRYNGEIYTLLTCCNCGLIYMAIDCEGNLLCDPNEDCMSAFDQQATYLFSVKFI